MWVAMEAVTRENGSLSARQPCRRGATPRGQLDQGLLPGVLRHVSPPRISIPDAVSVCARPDSTWLTLRQLAGTEIAVCLLQSIPDLSAADAAGMVEVTTTCSPSHWHATSTGMPPLSSACPCSQPAAAAAAPQRKTAQRHDRARFPLGSFQACSVLPCAVLRAKNLLSAR